MGRASAPVVLALCAGAIVAGMASFTAIAGWVTDVPADLLTGLYARCGRNCGKNTSLTLLKAPSKATLWRLTAIDAAAADAVIGAWLLQPAAQQTSSDAGGVSENSEIAVDGKTLRGAKDDDGNQVHLLAVMTYTGLVAAQVEVAAKTNEIPKFPELLDTVDISGAVVTADALHTPTRHRTYLHQHGADFFFCVKENQPKLFAALVALPWNTVPVSHTRTDRGHGRIEHRSRMRWSSGMLVRNCCSERSSPRRRRRRVRRCRGR